MSVTIQSQFDHVFNDDLLANPGDAEWIARKVPRLAAVLDFPELRDTFAAYDKRACDARQRTQRWGLLSVVFAVLALLATATEPLWGGQSWLPRLIGTATELIGLVGALVGVGGLWLGPSKRSWLLNRLMAERIRQWHFQFLVNRGDLVCRACGTVATDARAEFLSARQVLFQEFLHSLQGKLDSLLTSLMGVNYASEARLIASAAGSNHGYEKDRDTFDSLAESYQLLRIRHQLQYAQHKLQHSTEKPWRKFLSWPPIVQERVLGGLGAACLGLALLVSVGIILGHVLAFIAEDSLLVTVLEHASLNSLAVALAVVAVAIRTVEDGLGIKADVDRYQHYANRMQHLSHEFEHDTSIRNRLRIMTECEQLCFEEMREFMVLHHSATFAL
jgi:hypothetical protein